MPGKVTFNLMHEGLLGSGFTGHMNVTLSRDGESVSLGQNFSVAPSVKQSFERAFDILLGKPFVATGAKDGTLSSQYEAIRLTTSTQSISKSLIVDDASYDRMMEFFKAADGRVNDYGFFIGQNCVDFFDAAYAMTGAKGKLSAMFSDEELDGSTLGWLLLGRKHDENFKVQITPEAFLATLAPREQQLPKPASSSFASAEIAIPMLLLVVMLTKMAKRLRA